MFEYNAQAVRRSEKRPTRLFFLDQQVRQVGQEPNPPIPGQPVTTYYEVSEALVTEGMWKAGMGDIKDNDDLYLYAIMVSIDGNGNVRKGPFIRWMRSRGPNLGRIRTIWTIISAFMYPIEARNFPSMSLQNRKRHSHSKNGNYISKGQVQSRGNDRS